MKEILKHKKSPLTPFIPFIPVKIPEFQSCSRCSNNIGKNAGCCHIRTCSRALDHERQIGITVSVKENGVVFTRQICEIVVRPDALQADGCSSFIKRCDVLERKSFLPGIVKQFAKVIFVACHLGVKVFDRSIQTSFGKKRHVFDVAHFQFVARLAGKYEDLSGDIGPA